MDKLIDRKWKEKEKEMNELEIDSQIDKYVFVVSKPDGQTE